MNTETRSEVRVLVVDDSAFMRAALSRMISSDPGLKVIATAASGAEALEKIPALDPDVVTLDIRMPGLDGLETLRRIMLQFPRPVIVLSSAIESDEDTTFKAMAAGAFACIPKNLSATSLDISHLRTDLVAKIQAAAQARRMHSPAVPPKKPPRSSSSFAAQNTFEACAPAMIAIGSSTGGPQALQQILPRFPANFPVPILLVQHMPAGFTGPFAKRMNALCPMSVREATHAEPILPGTIYMAPHGLHMTVVRQQGPRSRICLDCRPEGPLHIPSVDVLMKSVAENYGKAALGVILTGMGNDGAEGMKAIHRRGGVTIGQDEASCTIYGMPRACAQLGVLSKILPLSDIPGEILRAVCYRKPA